MMKTFIRNLFFFSLFSGVFYLLMLMIWGTFAPTLFESNIHYKKFGYGYLNTRLKELKEVKDVDILFLGASITYRGFDPRNFEAEGYTSFNLGSSAQAPVNTELILTRYFENIKPKLIIYDVSPTTLESDGVESSVDIIANDQNDFSSYLMAYKINQIKTYNTLLYATIREFFVSDDSQNEPLEREGDKYIAGGFVQKEFGNFSPIEFPQREIEINQLQIECLENNLKKLKEAEVDVILVNVPVPKVTYSSFTNYEEFDSLMSTYGEYYNFNKTVNLDDSLHFYDQGHLNQAGVNIFNKHVIELLSKRNN